jgi:hypothetical protein
MAAVMQFINVSIFSGVVNPLALLLLLYYSRV